MLLSQVKVLPVDCGPAARRCPPEVDTGGGRRPGESHSPQAGGPSRFVASRWLWTRCSFFRLSISAHL